MNNSNDLELLLRGLNKEFKHQREVARITGEQFNIFSILNVESKEVRTHSAFLSELLNPEGTHLQGDLFLKSFLKEIGVKNFETLNSKVFKELYLGPVTDSTGGQVDILIRDIDGNTICIENKIYAGDQDNQVLRYCNYNKKKNTVFYLTLFGDKPDDKSALGLDEGDHYHLISYRDHILPWLKRCQEQAINVPMLREAIHQYELLIKKLTHQMIDPKEKNIRELLFRYAESSQFIATNFENTKNAIKERFRDDIAQGIRDSFGNLVDVVHPNPVSRKTFSQIFVRMPQLNIEHIQILIESFSGYGYDSDDPSLFIGILDFQVKDIPGRVGSCALEGKFERAKETGWHHWQFLTYDHEHFEMNDLKTLKDLSDPDSSKYADILETVSQQCIAFIEKHYIRIEAYVNQKTISSGNDGEPI